MISHKDEADVKQLLIDAILHANEVVYQKASEEEELCNMGTTVVGVIVKENIAYIAHVGDSRCYVWREEQLEQLTVDHSHVEDLLREGIITAEEAKHHPDKHKLSRAIGVEEFVEVDLLTYPLQENEKLLLCTDGLTNMVSDDDIFQIIKKNESSKRECEKLVELANLAGGRDNITVTIFEYRSK